MLRLRLASAAILIPILLVVLWAGGPLLMVAIALVVVLAAGELADLLRRAGLAVSRVVIIGLSVVAIVEAAAAGFGYPWALPGWIVLVALASAAVALAGADMRDGLMRAAGTALGALLAGMLAYLLRIVVTADDGSAGGRLAEVLDPGRVWLLVVVVGVWAYDTAAYTVGRIYGRGRFFAHISPNKTWSGAIGGTLGAIGACAALGALVGRPIEAAGVGLLIAFAAPLGDLTESVLKRAAGVKDSGQLIPGHGGMLDRMDSFVVAAPASWVYLALLGLA